MRVNILNELDGVWGLLT